MIGNRLFSGLILIALFACTSKKKDTLFSLVENSNINFVNTLEESKEYNVFKYRNFYNGGGVATGDINNDGLADVFFTANQSANKLYLNKGNLQFEDISEKAGFGEKKQWSTGVVFVDINADGWLDIYVCNAGNMLDKPLRKNQLFINNHNLTFTDKAAEYGLDNDGYSTQASFFDFDLDGDLDCFLVNNSPIPVNTLNYANMRAVRDPDAPFAEFLKGGGDHLYRNDNGKFVDISKEAGIFGSIISFGLGVTVGDVNLDGYPDVYVSNDFFEKDYLYINQKNGTFKDELEQRMQHVSFSSMGADLQDINNDGKPDIFTTDMLPGDDYRLKTNTSFEGYEVFKLKQNQGFYNQFTQNALQVNNGEGKFLETAFYSGVAASDWSWGALMLDADNDGRSDIFVCNGIYRDVTDQDFIDFFANDVVNKMALTGRKEEVENVIKEMPSVPVPNKAFRNLGQLKFSDESDSWGFEKPTYSNGAAYADLDNDGDLDMIINNVNQPALVYKNNSREKYNSNYISLNLSYLKPNAFAIGTKIKVYQGAEIITRELIPSKGFQSSVEYKQTIGLGNGKVDSIEIVWPNQNVSTILTPQLNTALSVSYEKVAFKSNNISEPNVENLIESISLFDKKYTEDDYVDFYTERNVPFMLSRLGPKAAVADVNGDGLEDVFIGTPNQQPRELYLQSKNGFQLKEVPDFRKYIFNDVTSAFFFDCDGDGDKDLFVGGGGNFADANSSFYQNQIYLNDGKGNFNLKPGAIPMTNTNCGAAVAYDYDSDGKLDLFIGSRSTPQQYGVMPNSFIMHNDGSGQFSDVSSQLSNLLQGLGMITSATVADINNDKKMELVIVGEWMAPMILSYNGRQFEQFKTGLTSLTGWWQLVQSTDIDKDGDVDLLLGNLGENFYLRPSSNLPVKLWVKDFDQNGTVDKIISQTIQNKDMPVFLKKEITDQIPSLKKMNLKHKDFANKSVQDLLNNQLENVNVYPVVTSQSIIAYNDGKGNFTVKALPVQVQLSSVNGLAIEDWNNDSALDIYAAGNFFDLLPQFCRVDASFGNLLLNSKNQAFAVGMPSEIGVSINGQVKDIQPLTFKGEKGFLVLQNEQIPLFIKKKKVKQ